MELSWPIKLRIAVVAAIGVLFVGILAWPLAAPSDPLGAVNVSNISFVRAVTLVLLAFLVGFSAYFVSWPYGREIGILAVPSGLAIWAGRCGSMAKLVQQNPTLHQRQELFAVLKWEPFFWLLIVAAGFAGVLLGQRIWFKSQTNEAQAKSNFNLNRHLNIIAALFGSVVIAHFCIKILAQDVNVSDNSVVAQPPVGQIIFAVLVSFGLAAFIVKKLLNINFIWPTIAAAFVTTIAINTYAKQNVLQNFLQTFPATFFSSSVISILPIQMVTFATLGSIAGYWLAVSYTHHRKHEKK